MSDEVVLDLEGSDTSGETNSARFARLNHATAHLDAPFAVLDLNGFTANLHDLQRRARGVPIRVASKSIRSVEVLRAVLAQPGFHGVLAYTLPEAIHLVRSGVANDVVVAYPTAHRSALIELAQDEDLLRTITLMVDHPQQLDLIGEVIGENTGAPHNSDSSPVRMCLDFDCSYRVGGVHIGVRRSAIHTPEQAEAAARVIMSRPHFKLVGLMGYEAQIAGVTDDSPAISAMKALSIPEIAARRDAAVRSVSRVTALEFVNGGGTGSIESTRADTAVTEIAAGSGLYGPHLFDRYRQFTPAPAVMFTLDVTRHPASKIATVLGGGWIASGASGKDRAPEPVWPPGLSLTATEGAGEVQTPLKCAQSVPRIGDRVWFRHTKSGEVAEHVNEMMVVRGDSVVARVATYRGEGLAFL
ncbi:MAG: amino acid deaminase/aldolase [Canibacter sp.]